MPCALIGTRSVLAGGAAAPSTGACRAAAPRTLARSRACSSSSASTVGNASRSSRRASLEPRRQQALLVVTAGPHPLAETAGERAGDQEHRAGGSQSQRAELRVTPRRDQQQPDRDRGSAAPPRTPSSRPASITGTAYSTASSSKRLSLNRDPTNVPTRSAAQASTTTRRSAHRRTGNSASSCSSVDSDEGPIVGRRVRRRAAVANEDALATQAPSRRPTSPERRSGDKAHPGGHGTSCGRVIQPRHAREPSTRRIGRNPQTEPHSTRNGVHSRVLKRRAVERPSAAPA